MADAYDDFVKAQKKIEKAQHILQAVKAKRKMMSRGYDIGGDRAYEFEHLPEMNTQYIDDFTAYLNSVGRKARRD